jgi:hypothetical protein
MSSIIIIGKCLVNKIIRVSYFFLIICLFSFLLLFWVGLHLQGLLQCTKYTWIVHLCCCPSSPLPSWNSFNRYHFCIYIYVYILFAPYSYSYPFPCHLLLTTGANMPSTGANPHRTFFLQKMFCYPVLWFCRRKKIKDNKENMTFLLVWDKDRYTRSILVLFPCIYVLQPKLAHQLFFTPP